MVCPARTADEPEREMLEPDESLYQVFVDDNFHYRDESHRYLDGQFATYDEAVAHCRAIVDGDLENAFKPGATAEERFATYSLFGLDPFIKTPPERRVDPPFSAWDYAKERCGLLPRDATIPEA
ncbi:hypothetical protein EB232_14240 [Mesorhizobium sp. NZP2077]|nr:hypothetical protein EB232_14240 [Mesorhizobium sp. NZP2077]